jgi:hypothetical protein
VLGVSWGGVRRDSRDRRQRDVIAAVLLLHERSVEQIVAELSAAELEQVIKLVERSPRVYPPGTLEALRSKRNVPSPAATAENLFASFWTRSQSVIASRRMHCVNFRTDHSSGDFTFTRKTNGGFGFVDRDGTYTATR